jgi:dihydrofolate reductase
LALAATPAPATGCVCVIGGGQIYAAALPLADELVLTELDRDFDGDTRFPDWPRSDFDEAGRERLRPAPPNDFDIDFVCYRRRAAAAVAAGAPAGQTP